MKHIQSLALTEPLVDVVESNSIVSDSIAFQTIDLYTVKIEDLTFKVPFTITATRDDYIHAFVSYFDIAFTASHTPLTFSTGPASRYTHWKQVSITLI